MLTSHVPHLRAVGDVIGEAGNLDDVGTGGAHVVCQLVQERLRGSLLEVVGRQDEPALRRDLPRACRGVAYNTIECLAVHMHLVYKPPAFMHKCFEYNCWHI